MGVLNFSTDNLITGVNVIDGNLYWTDNLNEPKKLEIDRFRNYDHTSTSTNIRGVQFNESDITVIKMHPSKTITLDLEEYNPSAAELLVKPNPPFEKIFPRFSYRWKYEDGQYSPYAPFTEPAFVPKTRSLTGNSLWSETAAYSIGDTVNYNDRSWVAVLAVSAPTPPAVNNAPDLANSATWTEQGLAVYTSEEENYIEGYNTTMFNNVGKITLKDIPRGPRDVVAVDLLYTESISSTIYVLETIDIPLEHRGIDFALGPLYQTDDDNGRVPNTGEPRYPHDYSLLPLRYQLSARKIYSALPANQLSRPYDEVPHKAKAQEITANRLIYGNYEIGFDQPESLQITNEFVSAGSGDGLHVKGNRTYEIGVAYIDAYGRQGSMIQAGSITSLERTTNGEIIEQIPLFSSFNQTTRQQIQSTITSKAPPWADKYRYFIKDTSTDFHNLISYNIYNDGGAKDNNSEFVWVEFQSTDRNKVQAEDKADEGTVLVLRRENDNILSYKTRFLVQEIANEAPEDVRTQVKEVLSNVSLARAGSYHDDTSGPFGTFINRSDFTPGSVTLSIDGGGNSGASRDLFQDIVVNQINNIVNKFQPESASQRVDEIRVDASLNTQLPIDITFDNLTSPIYLRIRTSDNPNTYLGSEFTYVQVLGAGNGYAPTGRPSQGGELGRGLYLSLGAQFVVNEDGEGLTANGLDGLPGSVNLSGDYTAEFYASNLSETALERLGGRFFVRTARNGLTTRRSEFTFDGELVQLNQLWFETEPITDESNLDLFWETSDTFCVCTEHGCPNKIRWFNSVAEVSSNGVYLESTRIFNKFNTVQLVNGVRVNTPTDRNAVIKRPYGLTWSGIYNGRTDTNRLNQFITADGITKELEPNYGSLQLLHTRDTNLIAACEDKIFRILADKDLLYNADGGGNISASNRVLGQTTPFLGEYGISKNPESFASYGSNFWITDKSRGVVIQVTPSNGQINEVSFNGLKDHFRDRLHSADKLVGSYDNYANSYVLSMQGYNPGDVTIDPEDAILAESNNITWRYDPARRGWVSRVSYIPEDGLSMNNKFYTYKSGKLFLHNSSNVPRNHFYNLPSTTDPNETSGISLAGNPLLFVNNNSGQPEGDFTAGLHSGGTNAGVSSINLATATAAIVNHFTLNFGTQARADAWRTSVGWPASAATQSTQQSLSSPVTFTFTFGSGKTITVTQPAGNIGCNYQAKITIGNPFPYGSFTQTGQDPVYSNGAGTITAWSNWPTAPTTGTGDYLSTTEVGEVPVENPTLIRSSYASEVEVILNDNPSAIKDFLTLGYEGTPGWTVKSIDTDSEDLVITNTWPFVNKENKYFAPIVSQINTYGLTDAGLGSVTADNGSTVFISGTQDKSGIKGFYNKVRLQYTLGTKAELFAINSENKISSN